MCICNGEISGGAAMISAASVKARLKNLAVQEGKSMQ